MATLRHAWLWLALLAATSCTDKLIGLQDTLTPLGQVHVVVKGDLGPLRPKGTEAETPRLRVALVWGQTYVAETFCWLNSLPGDPSATAVAAAGCRDVAGFVPQLVGANAAVGADGTATIDLLNLPTAEVMVGTVDARIAYGSILVYDDRDGNGTLDLHRPNRQQGPGGQGGGGGPPTGPQGPDKKVDYVYGASFLSMTLPDKRIAFREGTFAESAFYPRQGCSPPPVGFSVLGAGGFSIADVLLALKTGGLPAETNCSTETLEQAVVEIALQATETVRDVACTTGGGGATGSGANASSSSAGSARYQQPPTTTSKDPSPDLKQPWVCQSTRPKAKPGTPAPTTPDNFELVLAQPPADCKGLTHFILRGCSNDANCKAPQWDQTAHPPSWWPCPKPGTVKP